MDHWSCKAMDPWLIQKEKKIVFQNMDEMLSFSYSIASWSAILKKQLVVIFENWQILVNFHANTFHTFVVLPILLEMVPLWVRESVSLWELKLCKNIYLLVTVVQSRQYVQLWSQNSPAYQLVGTKHKPWHHPFARRLGSSMSHSWGHGPWTSSG